MRPPPHSLHKLLVEHIGVQVQLDGRRHLHGTATGAGSPQGRHLQHLAGGAGHSLSGNAAGSHGGASHVARSGPGVQEGEAGAGRGVGTSVVLRAALAAQIATCNHACGCQQSLQAVDSRLAVLLRHMHTQLL